MRKVIDNKNKNSQPKLIVEDFNTIRRCFFVAYSDMWE